MAALDFTVVSDAEIVHAQLLAATQAALASLQTAAAAYNNALVNRNYYLLQYNSARAAASAAVAAGNVIGGTGLTQSTLNLIAVATAALAQFNGVNTTTIALAGAYNTAATAYNAALADELNQLAALNALQGQVIGNVVLPATTLTDSFLASPDPPITLNPIVPPVFSSVASLIPLP